MLKIGYMPLGDGAFSKPLRKPILSTLNLQVRSGYPAGPTQKHLHASRDPSNQPQLPKALDGSGMLQGRIRKVEPQFWTLIGPSFGSTFWIAGLGRNC